MTNSIQCPYCKRKMFTKIGTYVKTRSVYSLYYNYLQHIPVPYDPSEFESRIKNKSLLGFYCTHCLKILPEKLDSEIIDYIRYKKILMKLKS